MRDVVVTGVERRHRRGLGEPIGRCQLATYLWEGSFDPFDERRTGRRSAVGDSFDGRGVVLVKHRTLDNSRHDGRNSPDRGDLFVLDNSKRAFRIKLAGFEQDQLAARSKRGDHRGVAAGRVEQRNHQQAGRLQLGVQLGRCLRGVSV